MAHPFPAHLDHLTIAVSNVVRSKVWYTSDLGLKVEFETPSHCAVALDRRRNDHER